MSLDCELSKKGKCLDGDNRNRRKMRPWGRNPAPMEAFRKSSKGKSPALENGMDKRKQKGNS